MQKRDRRLWSRLWAYPAPTDGADVRAPYSLAQGERGEGAREMRVLTSDCVDCVLISRRQQARIIEINKTMP